MIGGHPHISRSAVSQSLFVGRAHEILGSPKSIISIVRRDMHRHGCRFILSATDFTPSAFDDGDT
jgi:hypothetical protein